MMSDFPAPEPRAVYTMQNNIKNNSTLPFVLGALFAAPVFVHSTVHAQGTAIKPRAWEHETSDIAVNPRIKFGSLSNGMRFAWMANSEPKDRCYARLHINVGSLAEEESELGMAHFLEHMCFNGSRNFPAGTLVEWFQKHGMSFGADTNAKTAFDETIYELDLPKSDAKLIQEGLQVLRDFAGDILLAAKEVEAEKGVIDAEDRERDSAMFRVLIQSLKIQYAGTRVGDRLPIGTKPVRDKFTDASIRNFYKKWYRPENMTVVIVGDLKDLNPEKLIRDAFENFAPPAQPWVDTPSVGKMNYSTKEYYIYDKELTAVNIGVQMSRPWVDRPSNRSTMVAELPLDFARRMLNTRFSELTKKSNIPFTSASVSSLREMSEQIGIRVEEGEALNVVADPAKWDKALARCEKELRRALEFGFNDSELAEVRANLLRALDESVDREKTRPSGAFLNDILDATENRSVPTTAAVVREILKPVIEKLTPEMCHEAFKKAWTDGTLIIGGSGGVDLGADGGQKLRAVFDESRKVEVKPLKKEAQAAFAYASDPAKAGEIVSNKKNDEFDFTEVVFANGVRLIIKKTDFQEKQILLSATFGEGGLVMPENDVVLEFMAPQIFAGGGLGKHSADDLRKIMAGKQASVTFGMSDDSFVFSGTTTSEDLVRQCELMCAYFNDAGFREDALEQVRKFIPLMFEQIKHNVNLAILTKFMPELYNNDPSHRFPTREEVEAFKMESLKNALSPHLSNAPITLTFVGDLDIDRTIAAAARTFGVLPKRRATDACEARRKPVQLKTGGKFVYDVETEVPKANVIIAFPATDGRDTATRRRLNWLAQVLGDRLRIEVREKLGASYSPGAGAQLNRVFPNDGFITINANADPDKIDALVEACVAAADALATGGVTDEELDRVREPQLAQLRDAQRNNGYWMQNLSGSHTKADFLPDLRTVQSFAKEVKAAELTPLAKQYLKRDRATIGIARPVPKEAAASSPSNGAAGK